MNRRDFVAGLVVLPAFVGPASAEVSTINLGKQYGLPFLPQMVMEDHKLIEAQAARLGINRLNVGWLTMGGPGALNDDCWPDRFNSSMSRHRRSQRSGTKPSARRRKCARSARCSPYPMCSRRGIRR